MRKLAGCSPEQLANEFRLARYCQEAIGQKVAGAKDQALQGALGDYVACLAAWGQGADLLAFRDSQLQSVAVDGQPISEMDLAFWLQDDAAGCQTGVLRDHDGSAVLWHTEEDHAAPGARVDRLRLFSFSVTDQGRPVRAIAFVYPDLLPGPAFGWRADGYAEAVDSLNLKPKAQKSGILANIAAWVSLRLGKGFDMEETVRYLGPFVDGYALTAVYSNGGRVSAQKIEFAGSQFHSTRLAEEPGRYLFQVNMFSDKNTPVAKLYESITDEKHSRLAGRLDRATRHLAGFSPQNEADAFLLELLCSRDGADHAYANPDVKANLICKLSAGAMKASVGAGPAMRGEERRLFQHRLG